MKFLRREEVLYREALVLGLDRDDTVIRRRLRQKMQFVSEDFAAQVEPSDDELLAYLTSHPLAFAIEPRFTFRQVYLDPQRRGANLARDLERLVAGSFRVLDMRWPVWVLRAPGYVVGTCGAYWTIQRTMMLCGA